LAFVYERKDIINFAGFRLFEIKKSTMKNVNVVVTIVTLCVLSFELAIMNNVADDVIFTMFVLSPCLVIYMVYVVLKSGKPSGDTFNEKFYDDWDYRRNGSE
jgi:hypothetical protein